MMRVLIRGLVLAALAVIAVPAQAQTQSKDERAVRATVARIYAGYAKPDGASNPAKMSFRLSAVTEECAALGAKLDKQEGDDTSYGTCSNDYDLFCQCQDPFGIGFASMKIGVTFPDPDSAETLLQWSSEGPDLKLFFVRVGGKWLLDDAWEYSQTEGGGEPAHRKRLLADIATMRTTLKLPAWAEPAL